MAVPISAIHMHSTHTHTLFYYSTLSSGLFSQLCTSIPPVLQTQPTKPPGVPPTQPSLPSVQTLSTSAVLLKRALLPARCESRSGRHPSGLHACFCVPPPAVVTLSEAIFQVSPPKGRCTEGRSKDQQSGVGCGCQVVR